MYIVAQQYVNAKTDQISLMSETFHDTIEKALDCRASLVSKGYRDLIIAKVLTIKTVIVDYDHRGELEIPLTEVTS